MDAFATLGLPRRLVIDSEELALAVREASRSSHPDAGGATEEFAEVRRAGDLLGSPGERLKLALELSGGEWDSRGSVVPEVMDFFSPVAGILEKVEQFVLERRRLRSALGKAVLDARVPALKGEVETLIAGLAALEEALIGRFESFDSAGWENSGEGIAETARALIFVTKWQARLRASTGKLFEALLGG